MAYLVNTPMLLSMQDLVGETATFTSRVLNWNLCLLMVFRSNCEAIDETF